MTIENFMFNGTKSIPLSAFPKEAWTEIGQDSANTSRQEIINSSKKLWTEAGIVNRCVTVRATTLAALPWSVYKGEEVIISSSENEFPPGFEWLVDLNTFLFLTEASLSLLNEAFWFKSSKVTNKNSFKFQWLQADSMSPVWDGDKGLVGFNRSLNKSQKVFLDKDEVVYVWLQDPFSETRPAIPPAYAALSSGNSLINYNKFVSEFFARGAVKATILRVDRGAKTTERQKVKSFWDNMMSGVSNAWRTVVLSSNVEPIVVGEGLNEINDVALSEARQRDIATIMGVPHSILFSNAATYSTAAVEERNFYTYTIIPEAILIAQAINDQILAPLGLKFSFEWSKLQAFQTNALERAKVFKSYIDALVPHDIAGKMAGLVLPEGMTWEQFGAAVQENIEATAVAKQNANALPDGDPESSSGGRQAREKEVDPTRQMRPIREKIKSATAEWAEDASRFEKWFKNRGDEANPNDFVSDYLTDEDKLLIILNIEEQ